MPLELKNIHLIRKIMMECLEILAGILLASFNTLIILPECIKTFQLQLNCLLPKLHCLLLNAIQSLLNSVTEILLSLVECFHLNVKKLIEGVLDCRKYIVFY